MQLFNRKSSYFRYVSAAHCDSKRPRLQSLSFAGRTRGNIHESLILCFDCLRSRLPVSALHIFEQSFKSHIIHAFSALPLIKYFHALSVRPVNQDIMDLFRIFFKWRIQIKPVLFAESVQNRPCKTGFVRAGLPSENRDRSFIDRKRRIRDDQFFRELHFIPQAVTFRACSKRVVKRKTSRFDLFYADPAVRTGKALTEIHRLPVDHIYNKQPFRQMEHAFHGIRQTLLDPRPHNKSVHYDLNIVLYIFIQCDIFRKFI